MDTRKTLTEFTTDVLRLRDLLQNGRSLTPAEETVLKTSLENLEIDLDDNLKRRLRSQ